MFYLPDKIILLVESTDATARFAGPSSECLKEANVPCTIDYKKSAAGDLDKRVRTDAKVIVPFNPANFQMFKIGAEFAIARIPNTLWEIADVDIQEGVFNNAQTMELRCIRKNGHLPQTGEGSVRQRLAAIKASKNNPVAGIPGTGPGLL